jgi:hypothetical protein
MNSKGNYKVITRQSFRRVVNAFMKIRIIAVLLVLAASGIYAGDNPLVTFNQANDAYAHGQYQQAIGLYQSLAEHHQTNAAVFFNLGNAYFKNQQIGKAVVNLERAARLAPRDKDIEYNLRYLKTLVKEPSLPFFEAVVHRINALVSLNEIVAGTSLFFIICIGLLIFFLLNRGPWFALGSILAFLALVTSAAWLGVKIKEQITTDWAVVVTGTVDARNGPGTDNSVAFSVPEGREVMILGENNNWYAIGLPHEGITGWVEKESIEPVGTY